MHAQSTTKPFQSNLSKTLIYDNCPKLNDWKNVDNDLKHKCTDKENEAKAIIKKIHRNLRHERILLSPVH